MALGLEKSVKQGFVLLMRSTSDKLNGTMPSEQDSGEDKPATSYSNRGAVTMLTLYSSRRKGTDVKNILK